MVSVPVMFFMHEWEGCYIVYTFLLEVFSLLPRPVRPNVAGGSGDASPRTVSILVNGRAVEEARSVETPLDLRALIEMTARRYGVNRYSVFINGTPVSPDDVPKVFERDDRLEVDIRQVDAAANPLVSG